MAGELARMFASLGFKVDPTGADLFESKLRGLRESSANFARNLGVVGQQLDKVKSKVNSLNSAIGKDQRGTGAGASAAYSKLAAYVERIHCKRIWTFKRIFAGETHFVSRTHFRSRCTTTLRGTKNIFICKKAQKSAHKK